MSNTTKRILLVGAIVLAIGFVLATVGFALGGANNQVFFNKSGFHVDEWSSKTTQTETVSLEGISSLELDLDLFDVEVVPGESASLEYTYHNSKDQLKISKEGTMLRAIAPSQNQNFALSLFSFPTADRMNKLTLYLPQGTRFSSLDVDLSVGDVQMSGLTLGSLVADLDLGSLFLTDIDASRISADLSAGELEMVRVKTPSLECDMDLGSSQFQEVTAENMTLDSASGSIELADVHITDKLELSSDLGAIEGTGLITQSLKADSASGAIDLEGTFSGESVISSDLGAIEISTALPRNQYDYLLETDLGAIYIDGEKVKTQDVKNGQGNRLEVAAASGNINVNFG